MLYEKKYAIILERPDINFNNIVCLIQTSYKMGLIPIIFLQDGKKYNNILNVYNKMEFLKSKFNALKEDNFKIIKNDYSLFSVSKEWEQEIKLNIDSINCYAFGLTSKTILDKTFLTNINEICLYKEDIIFIDKKLNYIISSLFKFCDILNVKTVCDKKYLDRFESMFIDRDDTEIYYDENYSTVFKDDLHLFTSNRLNLMFIDNKYIDLINKYDLSSKLFNANIHEFDVDMYDINIIEEFLNLNKINFNINNSKIILKQ